MIASQIDLVDDTTDCAYYEGRYVRRPTTIQMIYDSGPEREGRQTEISWQKLKGGDSS